MNFVLQPWQLLLVSLAGWANRQQRQVIDYLRTENQIRKEKLGKRRILLDDDQRRRLAVKGQLLGRKLLAAAEAMRRILVDNARRKRSRKRGGELMRQDFDALEIAIPDMPEDLVALDDALTKLAATDKTAAEVVQLRFFAGLALPELAQLLGISPRTADRLWAYARAWLHQEIRAGSEPSDYS